ncbi:MAG TPA: electron transfer flavoprotein subunit alpha/FixB family protein [Ktedonobacteraceae bacterium]|nr:electron transfer flavoprotein subunit alpha/FixB family protein [Ktedonobacteraceae bacterium]
MAEHDVFVIAEHLEGKLSDVTFEMLGKARSLAPALGGRAVAVLLGHEATALAGQLGAADQVLYIDDAGLRYFVPERAEQALRTVLSNEKPALTMIANTSMGMDLAAALSAALDWPLIAYCSDAQAQDGKIVATSQIYGGKIAVETRSESASTLVSVLAGAFPASEGHADRPAAIQTIFGAANEGRVRFKGLTVPEAGDVDITREAFLVSVGRGIGSKDNIELVEELANTLGASLAASRPIIDSGWLPKQRQVGKSGLTVKPKLYMAVGISGAPEHLQGMRDAELIIAINSDAGAPIFEVADYGIVGDLFDIVPALTERLAEVRAK